MKPKLLRQTLSFLASIALVTIAELTQAGQPAQVPLYVSAISGKPNIMLAIDTSGSMGRSVPNDGRSRMDIAKEAAKTMVNNLTPIGNAAPTVRLGLASYNGAKGGKLDYSLDDLDSNHANAVKGKINSFRASGTTPLATTLSDIGYYFTSGPVASNLILHPGSAGQTSASPLDIFTKTDGSPILLGFQLADLQKTSCSTALVATKPDNCIISGDSCLVNGNPLDPGCTILSDFIPDPPGNSYGKASYAEAENAPPVQMLVVAGQPTFCIDASCETQNNFDACKCGEEITSIADCPSCSNTTGTVIYDPITFSTSPPASVEVSNNSNNFKKIDANDAGKDNSDQPANEAIVLSTSTNAVCKILDWQASNATKCDDDLCYVQGIDNGTCRVCATYAGVASTAKFDGTNVSCGIGQEPSKYCPNDNWNIASCANNFTNGCLCMDRDECKGKEPGATWQGPWNHTGSDAEGNSCSNNGDRWCNNSSYCDTFGSDCRWRNDYNGRRDALGDRCSRDGDDWCELANCGSGSIACDDCSWRDDYCWNDRDDLGNRCRGRSNYLSGYVWCNNPFKKCSEYDDDDCYRESGTCSSIPPKDCVSNNDGKRCTVQAYDVVVGNGIGGGTINCKNSDPLDPDGNGQTGGDLYAGNYRFDPTKYYRIQYKGGTDADIMGPYRGDQLNWYFQANTTFDDKGFIDGSLEISTNTPTEVCTTDTIWPIQSYCQKNFAIIISDGLPNNDRTVNPLLRNYTGDCPKKCVETPNSIQLPGPSLSRALLAGNNRCYKSNLPAYNMACQNGTKAGRAYEQNGSDYLDDVAKALYDIDLRPDLDGTNNVITYSIGFADPALINSSVLADAATVGGGKFFYASDADTLAEALDSVMSDISSQVGSSASVATNSTQVSGDSLVYQAKFDSEGWFGNFNAFSIEADAESADHGSLSGLIWDAGDKIPAFGDRKIFTYNGAAGAIFTCGNLTTDQKTVLGLSGCAGVADGAWLIDYLRGDPSHEIINGKISGADSLRSTDSSVAVFRNRTRIDPLTGDAMATDPWLLGDIVNSNPIYVGNTEDYSYSSLPGDEGANYGAFLINTKANRRGMVYVGANDGMLHGFDAEKTGATAGKEVLAYVPNGVYRNLSNLSSHNYAHRYFVDGSPTVGDAYINNQWRTVLVGTTGAGGSAAFALDITEPSTFTASKVLWELDDNTAVDLGFTLSEAPIVRMYDGSWAALLANGYYSDNNKAVLYIVKLQDGSILKTIEVANTSDIDSNADDGTFDSPNGLSTPFPADVNADNIVDYIYAGDLRGNLWKFDVTGTTTSSWKIANSNKPLYTACDEDAVIPCAEEHRQPITSRPVVGHSATDGEYMVYFGTGKYFDFDDNKTTQPQTFYGILDKSLTVPTSGTKTKANLVAQGMTLVTGENDVEWRTTTSNDCEEGKDGWYMDLTAGERVVAKSILHGDRIIFTTIIPSTSTDGNDIVSTDECSAGANGTGWLMELSAVCGKTTTESPWDVDGDGDIDAEDIVGSDDKMASGRKSKVGIPTAPGIIGLGVAGLEVKYVTGSSGEIESMRESVSTAGTGRQSWRQLR